jgi:hypothetical protein
MRGSSGNGGPDMGMLRDHAVDHMRWMLNYVCLDDEGAVVDPPKLRATCFGVVRDLYIFCELVLPLPIGGAPHFSGRRSG